MTRERSIRSKRPTIMAVSTSSSSILDRSIFEKIEPLQVTVKEAAKTFYDNWSDTYEWDLLDMGYRLHEVATTLLMDNVENIKKEDCFVMDVACGTGLVGSALRKKDFAGILHGVDESEPMLKVASRKDVYDDLYMQHLCPEDKIDVTEDLFYDGLTCISALGSDHIHPDMLPSFVEHVKSDGVLVFSIANHPREESDKVLLQEGIEKLVESKKIYEVSCTKEFYFNRGRSSRDPEMAATCQLYCFIKT